MNLAQSLNAFLPQNLSRAIHLIRTYLMTNFSTFLWHFAYVISSIWLWLFVIVSSYYFFLRNSRLDVFISDTHHFLASHSVSSSPFSFSLMVASNCQLFYLSNQKENYSRRTTAVIVTVLTKVLSFN